MRRSVLVTGGPVAANLDAVKLITNRFKGGRMLALAGGLVDYGNKVTYLASELPGDPPSGVNVVYHSGFDDYMAKVVEMAPHFDSVVLGAAVANLIPDPEWKDRTLKGGKFPSHLYAEGDLVSVDMRIAPRVINLIRGVAPRTMLVGFKLLSGVSRETLIEAARVTQRESRANLIVANDATDLDVKFGVTPEGGYYQIGGDGLALEIADLMDVSYYSTERMDFDGLEFPGICEAADKFDALVEANMGRLMEGAQSNGMIFGSVAVRVGDGGSFLISKRGKEDPRERVFVRGVDHRDRKVVLDLEGPKASLNAPLVAGIFSRDPNANSVVHWHVDCLDGFVGAKDYYPPGTVEDSCGPVPLLGAHGQVLYGIKGHGMYLIER